MPLKIATPSASVTAVATTASGRTASVHIAPGIARRCSSRTLTRRLTIIDAAAGGCCACAVPAHAATARRANQVGRAGTERLAITYATIAVLTGAFRRE